MLNQSFLHPVRTAFNQKPEGCYFSVTIHPDIVGLPVKQLKAGIDIIKPYAHTVAFYGNRAVF